MIAKFVDINIMINKIEFNVRLRKMKQLPLKFNFNLIEIFTCCYLEWRYFSVFNISNIFIEVKAILNYLIKI